MHDPVRVDAMTEADFGAVAAIEETGRLTGEQLRDELRRPWARTWVARDDDGVVGFLIAWHVADELHVLNVATRADRRRQGTGRALMSALLRYARERRVVHMLLEVRRSNRAAIALYRAVGLHAARVRSSYYPDGEDAVEMALTLDPETGEAIARADDVPLES